MPSENEINRLLNEITKSTVSNDLHWDMTPAPNALDSGTNDMFPVYLQTNFRSQTIGLYERRYQEYFPDFDSFIWVSRIGIIFLDSFKRIAWEYEGQNVGLNNLFHVARDSASGVDDIFSNLLKK